MIQHIGKAFVFYACPHWIFLWPWKFIRNQMVCYGMGIDPGEVLQCRICGATAERPKGINYRRDIFVHDLKEMK